jgi:Putative zinc-finger
MRECLEEGLIQSYADGELSIETMEAVATHTASCAACALAVREAEAETAIITSAFAPEMSLSVPTARLRQRLDAAIVELQPPPPLRAVENSGWRAWLGSLFTPSSFAPRQAIGFASLAAVVAFAVIFSVVHLKNSGSEYAREVKSGVSIAFSIPEVKVRETEAPDSVVGTKDVDYTPVKVIAKRARPRVLRNREEVVAPLVAKKDSAPKQPAAPPAKDALLPGERSYLTAIASLTTNLEAGGDGRGLKPSLRVEYERNLAVVDQAIEATRSAARSNPNDDDAANFLLTAYQSKVDLLNTVADQARLSASAR